MANLWGISEPVTLLKPSSAVSAASPAWTLSQITDSAEWERLASGFLDHNYRQSWTYGATSSERYGAQVERVAIRVGSEVIGLAAVRFKTIPLLKAGIAYVGGGPLTRRGKDSDFETMRICLMALQKEYLQDRGFTLRILPTLHPEQAGHDATCEVYQSVGFQQSPWPPPYRTVMVDLRRPKEEMRKKLAQKWRNCLNSAEKQGMTIEDGSDLEMFKRYDQLFNQFLDRKQISVEVPAEFYTAVRAKSPTDEGLLVSMAIKDGEPVAGLLTSLRGDTAVSLLGANGAVGLKHKAANLLQWHAMMIAKDRGLSWYDPGGIDPIANPGTYHFKSGLGGHEINNPGPFQAAPAGVRGSLMPAAEKFYRWTKRYAKWS